MADDMLRIVLDPLFGTVPQLSANQKPDEIEESCEGSWVNNPPS